MYTIIEISDDAQVIENFFQTEDGEEVVKVLKEVIFPDDLPDKIKTVDDLLDFSKEFPEFFNYGENNIKCLHILKDGNQIL